MLNIFEGSMPPVHTKKHKNKNLPTKVLAVAYHPRPHRFSAIRAPHHAQSWHEPLESSVETSSILKNLPSTCSVGNTATICFMRTYLITFGGQTWVLSKLVPFCHNDGWKTRVTRLHILKGNPRQLRFRTRNPQSHTNLVGIKTLDRVLHRALFMQYFLSFCASFYGIL